MVAWMAGLLAALANPSENICARRGLILGLGLLPMSLTTIEYVSRTRSVSPTLRGHTGQSPMLQTCVVTEAVPIKPFPLS